MYSINAVSRLRFCLQSFSYQNKNLILIKLLKICFPKTLKKFTIHFDGGIPVYCQYYLSDS